MTDKYCNDCYYWRRMGVSEYPRCCHYLLWTDKKRPCDPGEGCTVKIPMKVNRKKKGNNHADN